MSTYYTAPDRHLWTGRSVSTQLPPQYWYQVVEFLDLREPIPALNGASVLLGYAVEEGVRRNQGRVGAAAGPDVARGSLGRLACQPTQRRVIDGGNVICSDGNLELAQEHLSDSVEKICRAGGRPLIIGGGHDVAYGHFRGLHRAHTATGKTFGIVNFDAHLDLRDPAYGPTSGTPFHQILDEFGDDSRYLAVGIQRAANTPELLETARRFGVEILWEEDIFAGGVDVAQRLKAFADSVDHLYVTVDMDGFNGGFAPGVSAPNPSGFLAREVLGWLRPLLGSGKLVGVDVAEFCPAFDRDGITGRLVSRLVFGLV